ncbi:MAG: hypothetical protein MUC83_13110 [Pirellula sp.]|nr:hypothetical protein [Pirellula sp.]
MSIDSATETATLEANELDARSLEVTAPFVGKWNTLISQTNWEKGRIISEWRKEESSRNGVRLS